MYITIYANWRGYVFIWIWYLQALITRFFVYLLLLILLTKKLE
jgi:hypothetical protein